MIVHRHEGESLTDVAARLADANPTPAQRLKAKIEEKAGLEKAATEKLAQAASLPLTEAAAILDTSRRRPTPDASSRLIARLDVDAIHALPIQTVLLSRTGEVFQVRRVPTAMGLARAWYAAGYGEHLFGATDVAAAGPLRILFQPDVDIPWGVYFCSICQGTGQSLEYGQSSALAESWPRCLECGGAGWWDTRVEPATPVSLTEVLR